MIRRVEPPFDGADEGLHVFVPGMMGAGVFVSLGLLLADWLHQLGKGRGRHRRVQLAAGATAMQTVRTPTIEGADSRGGLRSRMTYALVGAASLGLGLYVLVGSFWNFWNPDGWARAIGWLWAVSTAVALGFTALGIVLGALVLRWPQIPSYALPLLRRTPLGSAPERT